MVLGVHTVPDGSANSAMNATMEAFTKVKQVGTELEVPTDVVKHSYIDSCVHEVAKLVGHLGVPKYGHGCNTWNSSWLRALYSAKSVKKMALERNKIFQYFCSDIVLTSNLPCQFGCIIVLFLCCS